MTVVPASFQLAGWIPAWWRGAVGGDDMLELVDPTTLAALSDLRDRTQALTAYCPALGVATLPGPRAVTEAAVGAGEAVVLHGRDRGQSHVLIPHPDGWVLWECDTPRPVDLDVRQAAVDMAEAVVLAERAIREGAVNLSATPLPAAVRPLPPDADSQRAGLLVRSVRLWTAVSAVDSTQRTARLDDVLRTAARATLAAYAAVDVPAGQHHAPHARRTV